MNINLMQFQLDAIRRLRKCMESGNRDIVLKSPTGSGKTIILTHFIDEYLNGHAQTVFVWLTPGKGSLEEQSKSKMDKYIHNSKTKLLLDVMTSGFEDGDSCFINWEKLTKKGNNALKDSERTNFIEWIEKARNAGLAFKVIIDESHQNFTEKADEIVQLFKKDKIIRCSATPLSDNHAELIEVEESEVIAEGLIKKLLVINENFPDKIKAQNQTAYLLDKALLKQRELRAAFLQKGSDVNPLIVIQLPNNSTALQGDVEKYLEKAGLTYENNQLAVWLSDRHENLDDIDRNNCEVSAIIIKQAVATGWDCPRAQILVKLRENMDETFEIQTIGRIRRMPEACHYGCDLLDNCYLYTFDEKFTMGVKQNLGSGACEAKTIFLKSEHKGIELVKEQRTMVTDLRDPRAACRAIAKYMQTVYKLGDDCAKNKLKLEAEQFVFSDEIIRTTISGDVAKIADFNDKEFKKVDLLETLDTHRHGKEYQNRMGLLGLEIGLEYMHMNAIVRQLFGEGIEFKEKILSIPPKGLYAFVINNFETLNHICSKAMAEGNLDGKEPSKLKSESPFRIPQSCLFAYDAKAKDQSIMCKNVYQEYRSSAAGRSLPEIKFEKFCEHCESIDWWYKNGDKGNDYLSIVYQNNSGKQKLFYPDYVLSVRGKIWIIETKGGFSRSGKSKDIDKYTEKKFYVLKNYLENYHLNGGIVRNDDSSDELCICMNEYAKDIKSENWELLRNVLEKTTVSLPWSTCV